MRDARTPEKGGAGGMYRVYDLEPRLQTGEDTQGPARAWGGERMDRHLRPGDIGKIDSTLRQAKRGHRRP